MKMRLFVAAGLVLLVGIVAWVVRPNLFSVLFRDPQSYYAIKIYRSAVVDEPAFRAALHKADWRREMKFRKSEGEEDVPIPDNPVDDPTPTPIGEIKRTRISVAGYVPKGPNWGAQVTQRAGFKNLRDLENLLAQVSPTPTPTPAH